MLKIVTLTRDGRRGDNVELLDVIERLARETYGSASNTAVNCIRASAPFQAMLERMRREGYQTEQRTTKPKAARKGK